MDEKARKHLTTVFLFNTIERIKDRFFEFFEEVKITHNCEVEMV